jgi:hypothetical protein
MALLQSSTRGEPMTSKGRLTIKFESANGLPILNRDLGASFMEKYNLANVPREQFTVMVQGQERSKKNISFEWDLNGVPLPDGFMSVVVVNDVCLSPGPISESKNGNQMRKDEGELEFNGVLHVASSLIVQTRRPFWVKVGVKKKPGKRRVN